MTNYGSLGDYGPNCNNNVDVNGDHGWGGYQWTGGVPDNLLGTARYKDITVTVRKELVELHQLAFQIADQIHHYKIWTHNPNGNGEVWGPWSYENRCISGTSTASNHSKGKATDWNAPYNPYYTGSGNWTSDFPPAMVAHLEAIGLCWGGRYGDCFTGDTLLITRDGNVPISELSGGEVELLSTSCDPRTGPYHSEWIKAPVQSYGRQQTYLVTLARRGTTTTIRTTAGHRWPVAAPKADRLRFITTTDLIAGQAVPALAYPDASVVALDPESIARGIVWGDGSVYNNHGSGRTPRSTVQLCGDKTELRSHLEPYAGYWSDTQFGVTAWKMPAELKSIPDPHAELPILAGFFAGWYACDGHAQGDAGYSISTSDPRALAWLHAAAPALGLTITGTNVQAAGKSGFHSTKDNVTVRIRDIPDWLLLRPKHHVVVRGSNRWPGWKVVSVVPAEVAEVFCPTVEGRNVVAVATPSVPLLTGQCMHWEFGYTPGDVAGFVAKAKAILGKSPLPPQPPEDDSMSAAELAALTKQIAALSAKIDAVAGNVWGHAVSSPYRGGRTVTSATWLVECREVLSQVGGNAGVIPAFRTEAGAAAQADAAAGKNITGIVTASRTEAGAAATRATASGARIEAAIAGLSAPTPPATYTVLTGDTLGAIATKFKTSVAILMALNKLPDPNDIAIGKVLILPSA